MYIYTCLCVYIYAYIECTYVFISWSYLSEVRSVCRLFSKRHRMLSSCVVLSVSLSLRRLSVPLVALLVGCGVWFEAR